MSATADETVVRELDARRSEVLRELGWGATTRFFQPRNLAFWVWLAMVGWGAYAWLGFFASGTGYYAPTLGLALLVFTVYGAGFWWFTDRMDRYATQPTTLRLMGFLWGAVPATWVVAAPANSAVGSLLAKWFGQAFSLDWGAALAVPVTEEWGKGVGLVLLMTLAPRVVRTPFDGFVLGAFIGLGFQLFENVLYVFMAAQANFGVDQIDASMRVFVLRMLTGVAAHILYSAVFCTGVIYLLGTRAQPRRVGRGLLLVLTAMALHFVWDAQGTILVGLLGDGAASNSVVLTGSIVGLPVLALVVVVAVFRVAVRSEREGLREVLAPEVARGVVTDDEVDAASGDRTARRRYRKAGEGRSHAHVLEAVFDLAAELGAAGGRSSERVELARSEVRRLRDSP